MRHLLLCLCCPMLLSAAFAQEGNDIYNYRNSMHFADYLRKTGQYKLAVEELQRLRFTHPGNDSVQFELLQTCRLGGFYQWGIRLADELFEDKNAMPARYASEYARILLLNGDFPTAVSFVDQNRNLNGEQRFFIKLNCELMQKHWQTARSDFAQQPADLRMAMKRYDALTKEAASLKYKHAGIALTLSAVVPGAGKAYTKNWGDALLSFVTNGALIFQAYRGFDKGGVNSAYGWVFGSLAFGFYTGNLYGSYKASKVYNAKLDEDISNRAVALFHSSDL